MKKRIIPAILTALVMAISLVGCDSNTESSNNKTSDSETSSKSSDSTPSSKSSSSETSNSEFRTVTDMAGREVVIPTDIEKIYCAVPTAEALICALAPEKLCAWVNQPSEDVLQYLPDYMADLPVVGGWMGQKVTANMEAIIAAAPDVIIYNASFNTDSKSDETADQITDQTNIPVLVVYDPLDQIANHFRVMGDYLGMSERGEELAEYCEKIITEIGDMVNTIPDEDLVTVYYAEGEGGLSTDPAGSNHTEVIDFVRGLNIADVEMLGGQGMTSVSMEQIIKWNPDLILVSASNPTNYNEILTNDVWKDIQAVKDGKVYMTPSLPFNWFDRPPNITRIIGIQWFAKVLYPEYVDIDINSRIKEFYSLFFNVEITDDDVAKLTNAN